MKLSEIRPCDACGGPLPGKHRSPMFYLVRFSPALFDRQSIQETMGLNMYFGGHALGLAEAMSPSPEAVHVAMDEEEHKGLMTELFICADCYTEPLNLAILAEKRAAALDAAKESTP